MTDNDFSWLNRHVPYQIGTHDSEGYRTFQTPGDVCLGCSDLDSGRWVAVSECDVASAVYESQRTEYLAAETEFWTAEEDLL